jgi:hypothetical protein
MTVPSSTQEVLRAMTLIIDDTGTILISATSAKFPVKADPERNCAAERCVSPGIAEPKMAIQVHEMMGICFRTRINPRQ